MNEMQFPDRPEDDAKNREGDSLWLDLLFPSSIEIASPRAYWVPNGPLGSARLASHAELTTVRDRARCAPDKYLRLFQGYAVAHDTELSIVDMGQFPIPCGDQSPNTLIVGQSGAGKTQKFTLPAAYHAIREGWTIVYINIKGQKQTRILQEFARSAGRAHEVKLLAPRQSLRSLKCSLLEGCEEIANANALAAAMVQSIDWCGNQAAEFLAHAIRAVCVDSPLSHRHLLEIRDVVLSGDYKKFAEAHSAFPVLKKFADYVTSGNTNAATVVATVGEATAFIDLTREFLMGNDFSVLEFVQQGGLCILEIDQHSVKRLRPLVTMLLGQMIGMFQQVACNEVSGSIPHKTIFFIDELMAAGPIPGLAETLHTCREMGFAIVAGLQAIPQLGAIYGCNWPAVLAGFSSQLVLPDGLDPTTAQYFSERSGIATIAVPTLSRPPHLSGTDKREAERDYHLVSRPTLLPSDITFAAEHPELGRPATILLGDGTPMFQAYLTPAYKEESIARLMARATIVSPQNEDSLNLNVACSPKRLTHKPTVDALVGFPRLVFPEGHFRIQLVEIGSNPQQVLRILSKLLGRKMRLIQLLSKSLPLDLGYCATSAAGQVVLAVIQIAGGAAQLIPVRDRA
ncbi:MAG: type IV secretory system conjugative DNA transfer family protein [Planctomycetaceae bacterium]|nr:type IV secretory system conjugative DNA transfer family protein [Planctomycetaceae bacterium]